MWFTQTGFGTISKVFGIIFALIRGFAWHFSWHYLPQSFWSKHLWQRSGQFAHVSTAFLRVAPSIWASLNQTFLYMLFSRPPIELRAAKKQQIKQNRTKQSRPTNQPTNQPQHKYPGSHYMKHHQKDKSIKLNDPSASPSCSSINRLGLLSILPTPHAPTKSKLNPSKLNASISSSRLIPYQAHSKLSTPNVHWNINNNIDLRGRGGNSIFYARSLGTQNKEKSGVWSAVMGFGCARLRASL